MDLTFLNQLDKMQILDNPLNLGLFELKGGLTFFRKKEEGISTSFMYFVQRKSNMKNEDINTILCNAPVIIS